MIGDELPLGGRRILVTRPAERSSGLVQRLERLGAVVSARPTIALGPPSDPGPAHAALGRLARYDWILFTSPSGVRFFFVAARELAGGRPDIAGRIGAVGASTARALAEQGFPPDVVAEEARAEGLAETMAPRLGPDQRVLLVRPEVTRPVLPRRLAATGAAVDTVAFYRNVPAADVSAIARDVLAGAYDVVVFTAPSTLARLLEAGPGGAAPVRDALRRMAVVAIGDVTAAACRQANVPVGAVADEPSDDGVVRAVQELYA